MNEDLTDYIIQREKKAPSFMNIIYDTAEFVRVCDVVILWDVSERVMSVK